jgi:hypothetical protein
MGGRVLNNSTGRFIQADILNFDPTSTISYSRYAYVLNRPYSYTDPTGYAPAHAQLAHEQEMAAQASSNPTTTASAAVTPSSSRVGDTVKGFALNAVYASGGALQAIGEGVMETTEDIVANSGIYANNTAQTIIDFPMYFLDVGLLNFIGLGTGADTRIWGKMTATASSLGYEAQRIKQAAASVDYRAFGSSVIGLGLVLNPRNLIRSSSVGNGYGVAKKVPTDPPIQQMNPKNLIPTQTKNEISGSQVKRLKKDMQKNGFDQSEPIDVVKNARGRLEIEDGHHRTEAAIKAGLDKVPVRVWE